MKDFRKKFKNLWIILGISLLLFFIYNFFTQDYINNYDVFVKVKDDGQIVVKESLEYVFFKEKDSIIVPINVIFNTSIFDSNIANDNSLNIYQKLIDNLSINIRDQDDIIRFKKGNEKEKLKIKKIDNSYVGIEIPKNFNKGHVFVDINYSINKGIVKFNDIDQIYLKFSNKRNNYKYKNFNIDIDLKELKPKKTNLYIYNNEKINEKKGFSNISYSLNNINKKSDFNIRVLFNSDINKGVSVKKINVIPTLNSHMEIYNSNLEKEQKYILFIIVITSLLVIYYILLLFKYDYNKMKETSAFSYDEIVEKINPVIAACLIGEREFEGKDILAIIMSIISKGFIKVNRYSKAELYRKLKLSNIPSDEREKILLGVDSDIFELEKSESENFKLDELEDRIYDMLFKEKNTIFLHQRLNEIMIDPICKSNLSGIKKYINDFLINIGARISPPRIVNFINIIIFAIIMILCMNIIVKTYIANNAVRNIFYLYNFGQYDFWETLIIFLEKMVVLMFIIAIIQIIMYVLVYFVYFVIYVFDKTSKRAIRYILKNNYNIINNKTLVSVAYTLNKGLRTLNVMSIIIFILYLIIPSYMTIISMIPVTLVAIIFNSTIVMKKHSEECEKLYLSIYILFDKLKNGSLLKDKKFKDNVLWDKYLSFSLAFGISNDESFDFDLKNNESLEDLKNICAYMISNSDYLKTFDIDKKEIKFSYINKLKKILKIIIIIICVVLAYSI